MAGLTPAATDAMDTLRRFWDREPHLTRTVITMPPTSNAFLVCACAMTALLAMWNRDPLWLWQQTRDVPLWLPVSFLVVLGIASCGVMLTHPLEIAQAFGQDPENPGFPVVVALGP